MPGRPGLPDQLGGSLADSVRFGQANPEGHWQQWSDVLRSDLKPYEKIEEGLRANYPTDPTGAISRYTTAGPRVRSPSIRLGNQVARGAN